MEKDAIKIDELEYFNPFEPIEHQFKHLPRSRILACNLSVQQRVFLFMACCKNMEEDETLTFVYEEDTSDDAHKSIIQEYKSMHNNRFNHFCGLKFTEKDKIELNNRIKKVKANINKYETKAKSKGFSDIVLMFELYNDMDNNDQKIFKNWNRIFKFENKTEIFNFQGCLGLLLLNNFCFHYQKEQISQCVLYAMLLTNLFKYSPIAHILEIGYLDEILEDRKIIEKDRKQKSTAGSTTSNEEYKQYCIKYMKDNNLSTKKAAEELASEFMENPDDIRNKFGATLGTQKKKTKDGYERKELPQYDAEQTIRRWLEEYVDSLKK